MIRTDAAELTNQYPAYTYTADIAGETRKALAALRTDRLHHDRYASFLVDMVYGERPEFDQALGSVIGLAEDTWPL